MFTVAVILLKNFPQLHKFLLILVVFHHPSISHGPAEELVWGFPDLSSAGNTAWGVQTMFDRVSLPRYNGSILRTYRHLDVV